MGHILTHTAQSHYFNLNPSGFNFSGAILLRTGFSTLLITIEVIIMIIFCYYNIYDDLKKDTFLVSVHGFKGSEVQGSILIPGLNLECVFTSKASSSSGLIQNWEPNWQLLGKMNIFNEDFGSSMPSLSLTLNVEP